MRAERLGRCGGCAAERAGHRFTGVWHDWSARDDPCALAGCGFSRHRLETARLGHGLPAVHAVVRAGVVSAAAIRTGGHRLKCSTGGTSYDLPIDSANKLTHRKGACYLDRKSTRLNSSHVEISYAVFCLKKKNKWVSIPYSSSNL